MLKIESREQLVSEIANALETHFDEGCFYLSITEQKISLNAPPSIVGEDCVWPHEGDKVIRIEPLSSRESFGAMGEFADTQPPKIADKLYRALSGGRPFARFKSAVDILELLQDWYAFKDKWYDEKAEEWLRDEGVDFVDGKVVATGRTLTWGEDEDEYDDWDDDLDDEGANNH